MFESDPICCERIDIRRADVLISVTAQMIGAEGINGDDHNIGSTSVGSVSPAKSCITSAARTVTSESKVLRENGIEYENYSPSKAGIPPTEAENLSYSRCP